MYLILTRGNKINDVIFCPRGELFVPVCAPRRQLCPLCPAPHSVSAGRPVDKRFLAPLSSFFTGNISRTCTGIIWRGLFVIINNLWLSSSFVSPHLLSNARCFCLYIINHMSVCSMVKTIHIIASPCYSVKKTKMRLIKEGVAEICNNNLYFCVTKTLYKSLSWKIKVNSRW